MLSCFAGQMRHFLDDREKSGLLRELPQFNEGFVDFSHNDYLELSNNESSINAGCEAAKKYGTGATGSRLLSGNKEIFEIFENIIADDKMSEDSIIFNSGYIANQSVLNFLCDAETLVVFDKLNHASMYEGVKNTNANFQRYNHLNYDQLEHILKKYNHHEKKIIATESVFGMDGDIANIEVLSCLSNKYNAILYLDEAHATGLYGKHGYGISTNFPLNKDLTIIMGTFSKAIASSGAYVACNKLMKKYLIQNCKSFIYSTALSPICIGVAMHNWQKISACDTIREKLLSSADKFRNQIISYGYTVFGSNTNIVPIKMNDISQLMEMKKKFFNNKIIVSAIRKPTSPSSRIRIAISANHSDKEIQNALSVLQS